MKDRRILLELDLSARKSDAQIAKRVGMSKESVKYRIDRLISNGVIQSFHTIVDVTKLGFLVFRIFLKLQGISKSQEQEMVKYLLKSKGVMWFVSCYGNWRYNILVSVKSPYDFIDFWNDFYENFGSFFEDRHISQFTRMLHFRRDYILPPKERPEPLVWGGGGYVNLDAKDLDILSVLSRNARLSLTEIGRKVGLTYKTVRVRIAHLEREKIILGYRPTLSLDKIGYKYYKIHFQLQRLKRADLNAFSSALAQNPTVFVFDETIGGPDFEVEVEAPSDDDVVKIINGVEEEFPELLRGYEILRYLNEYKVDYLPFG